MSEVRIRLGSYPELKGTCIVTLREGSGGAPLFLTVPGYADMRTLQRVAEQLGDKDRPVYGLWPPATERISEFRRKPLQHLVSLYVEEIKRIQPVGPYNLVGYSLGGMFVLEAARKMAQEGNEIGVLMLLDSFVKVPWFVTFWYLNSYRICNLTKGLSKFRWWMIRRRKSRLFACVTDQGQCTNVSLSRNHDPEPYPGRVVCVLPEKSWIWWANLLSFQVLSGKTADKIGEPGVEIYRMPGKHSGMLTHDEGRTIARMLDGVLERSVNGGGPLPSF